MMSFFRIENLSLNLGGFSISNIKMNLPKGKSMVILGPSGSGKSTLLEIIAGFYDPDTGSMWLEDQNITCLPPEKRQIGFMFQDHALFPHMTVRENVLFPFQFKRKDKHEKSVDINQIISMLKIERLLDRYPNTLSGGEKQRIALARALMRNPNLILFDEPMSALDARTREELREYLSQLLRELSLTSIYVTHDQEEAFALADVLCVMNEGRIIQADSKENIFRHPVNSFVARFIGMENLLKGKVLTAEKESEECCKFTIEINSFSILEVVGNYKISVGDEVIVGIRAEDILVESSAYSNNNFNSTIPSSNILQLTVKTIMSKGVICKLNLTGKISLTVLMMQNEVNNKGFYGGNTVMVGLPPKLLHLMKSDIN